MVGMARDSGATKARLLDAAFAEFAAHGISGARVDRIAEAANANKRLIYVYFGNKEQLFDTVIEQALTQGAEAVPFDAENLPDYAGQVFDHLSLVPIWYGSSPGNSWSALAAPTSRSPPTA